MNGTVGSNLNCDVGNLKLFESVSLASHNYSFGEQAYNVDDSVRAFCSDSQKERMDNLLEMSKWQKRGYHGGKSKFQNPCVMNKQSFGEGEGLFSSGCHGNDDGGGGNNVLICLQASC